MSAGREGIERTAQKLVQMTANNPPSERLTFDQAKRRVEKSVTRGDQIRENGNR